MKTLLCRAIETYAQVAVDCSAIDYISSAGVLVEGAAAARRAGRRFTLCPSPRVELVLKIFRLDTILSIESTLPSP